MPRILRSVLVFTVFAAALYATYLVGANLFLSTGLFEKVVNGSPETVWIHYSRGWTVLPGRIHAENLQIRGRDSNVEWILTIGTADFDVSFFALARKRFTVTRLRADDVSFRLRQRLDKPPRRAEEFAYLPPIPGLAAFGVRQPPLFDAGDWDDHYYHLWTVDLEDVRATHVREIWVDGLRFAGEARLRGRFRLKPLRALDVGPAEMTIAEGGAGHVGAPVARGLAGRLEVTLDRFDPRITRVNGIVHHGRLATDLRASLVDKDFAGDVPRFALELEHGVIMPGTHIEGAVAARGSSVAALVDVSDRLAFRAIIPGARIRGEISGLALGDPVRAVDIAAEGTREVTAGRLTMRAHAEIAARAFVWQFVPQELGVERFHAVLSDIEARAPGFVGTAERLELDGTSRRAGLHRVTGAHVRVALSGSEGQVGGRRWTLPHLKLALSTPAVELGHLRLALRGADVRLDVDRAVLDDAAGLRALVPSFPVEAGRATLVAHLDLLASSRSGSGAVDFSVEKAVVRANEAKLRGDVEVHLGVRAYQPDTQEIDLSGSRIVVEHGGGGNWRAVADVTGGLARLDRDPGFDLQLELHASDASPFLDAVGAPGIVAALVRMPGLRAVAHVGLSAGRRFVENVEAHGGNVKVHGGYRATGDAKKGDFVVKKGVFPFDIRIADDGVHVRPFHD